jgi:hypothetical protein
MEVEGRRWKYSNPGLWLYCRAFFSVLTDLLTQSVESAGWSDVQGASENVLLIELLFFINN